MKYPLMKPGGTTLLIHILMGQEEKHRELEGQPSGYHTIRWNASNLSSGVYFYRLQAGNYVQTRADGVDEIGGDLKDF